jgi:hypothetical protein
LYPSIEESAGGRSPNMVPVEVTGIRLERDQPSSAEERITLAPDDRTYVMLKVVGGSRTLDIEIGETRRPRSRSRSRVSSGSAR